MTLTALTCGATTPSPPSAVVVLANTDDYSIVARVRGGDASPILVLVDVLPGYAIRVERDSSIKAITACVDLIGELTVNLPRLRA